MSKLHDEWKAFLTTECGFDGQPDVVEKYATAFAENEVKLEQVGESIFGSCCCLNSLVSTYCCHNFCCFCICVENLLCWCFAYVLCERRNAPSRDVKKF
jgi:hypothetical protein